MRRVEADLVVIGGGAAGCAAALRARRLGLEVVLVDKSQGPPRRFCGEFLSGEALGSLALLDAADLVLSRGPTRIVAMEMHSAGGAGFGMPLALGGLGLTRATLDSCLLELARQSGVTVLEGLEVRSLGTIVDRHRDLVAAGPEEEMLIRTRAVVGAWGKRSSLDRVLGRRFLTRPSRWIGVKLHYRGAARRDDVSLFLFPGGHCGVVSVEGDLCTLALLARADALRRRCSGLQVEEVIDFARSSNRALDQRLEQAVPVPASGMSIAQVPLRRKEPMGQGVFLAGDSAGITAPFLGLGVANALASGICAAECAAQGLRRSSAAGRESSLAEYERWWRRRMGAAQGWSFAASALLSHRAAGELGVRLMSRLPVIAEKLYSASRPALPPPARGDDQSAAQISFSG